MFPKQVYVRIDVNNPDEPIIIADESIEAVMEGDGEQEIATYKYVKTEKVKKVIKVA